MSLVDRRRIRSRSARLSAQGQRGTFLKEEGWRALFLAEVEVARVDSLALRLGVGAKERTVDEGPENGGSLCPRVVLAL